MFIYLKQLFQILILKNIYNWNIGRGEYYEYYVLCIRKIEQIMISH